MSKIARVGRDLPASTVAKARTTGQCALGRGAVCTQGPTHRRALRVQAGTRGTGHRGLGRGGQARAGRPLEVAGIGRLRPAEASACHRRRREAALGACATASAVDPHARPAGFRDSLGGRGHPGEAPETLRQISRSSEGEPLGTGQASPGAQNGCRANPRGPDPITYSFSQFSDDRPCVKDKLSRLLCFLTNEVQRRVVADAVLLGPLGPTLLVAVTL
jgi:hypothetical protein